MGITKIPGIMFLLIPFFKYLKNHTYKSKNTWDKFFPHTLSQLFKKAYLVISKRPGELFLLIPFFKYSKKHTYESENTLDVVFAHTLFQIIKIAFLPI